MKKYVCSVCGQPIENVPYEQGGAIYYNKWIHASFLVANSCRALWKAQQVQGWYNDYRVHGIEIEDPYKPEYSGRQVLVHKG